MWKLDFARFVRLRHLELSDDRYEDEFSVMGNAWQSPISMRFEGSLPPTLRVLIVRGSGVATKDVGCVDTFSRIDSKGRETSDASQWRRLRLSSRTVANLEHLALRAVPVEWDEAQAEVWQAIDRAGNLRFLALETVPGLVLDPVPSSIAVLRLYWLETKLKSLEALSHLRHLTHLSATPWGAFASEIGEQQIKAFRRKHENLREFEIDEYLRR